jgi:hypothetical protein
MTLKPDAKLPPLPWSFHFNAYGFAYIVDANQRKIATMYGTPDEKILTAEVICEAVKFREEHNDD